MATFTVTIKLGNDAMQTGQDVAEALRTVADERLGAFYATETIGEWGGLSGGIFDANGNTVGRWAVAE